MSELRELRQLREAVYDLATDEDEVLTDEQWYDKLWELLDPVVDARAHRALDTPTHARPKSTSPMTFASANALLVNYQREKLDRAERDAVEYRGQRPSLPTHDAGEYRDPSTGRPIDRELEAHRFSFEGSTTQLADHLVNEHDALPGAVEPFAGGLLQGAWIALDNLHREAHEH